MPQSLSSMKRTIDADNPNPWLILSVGLGHRPTTEGHGSPAPGVQSWLPPGTEGYGGH